VFAFVFFSLLASVYSMECVERVLGEVREGRMAFP